MRRVRYVDSPIVQLAPVQSLFRTDYPYSTIALSVDVVPGATVVVGCSAYSFNGQNAKVYDSLVGDYTTLVKDSNALENGMVLGAYWNHPGGVVTITGNFSTSSSSVAVLFVAQFGGLAAGEYAVKAATSGWDAGPTTSLDRIPHEFRGKSYSTAISVMLLMQYQGTVSFPGYMERPVTHADTYTKAGFSWLKSDNGMSTPGYSVPSGASARHASAALFPKKIPVRRVVAGGAAVLSADMLAVAAAAEASSVSVVHGAAAAAAASAAASAAAGQEQTASAGESGSAAAVTDAEGLRTAAVSESTAATVTASAAGAFVAAGSAAGAATEVASATAQQVAAASAPGSAGATVAGTLNLTSQAEEAGAADAEGTAGAASFDVVAVDAGEAASAASAATTFTAAAHSPASAGATHAASAEWAVSEVEAGAAASVATATHLQENTAAVEEGANAGDAAAAQATFTASTQESVVAASLAVAHASVQVVVTAPTVAEAESGAGLQHVAAMVASAVASVSQGFEFSLGAAIEAVAVADDTAVGYVLFDADAIEAASASWASSTAAIMQAACNEVLAASGLCSAVTYSSSADIPKVFVFSVTVFRAVAEEISVLRRPIDVEVRRAATEVVVPYTPTSITVTKRSKS